MIDAQLQQLITRLVDLVDRLERRVAAIELRTGIVVDLMPGVVLRKEPRGSEGIFIRSGKENVQVTALEFAAWEASGCPQPAKKWVESYRKLPEPRP